MRRGCPFVSSLKQQDDSRRAKGTGRVPRGRAHVQPSAAVNVPCNWLWRAAGRRRCGRKRAFTKLQRKVMADYSSPTGSTDGRLEMFAAHVNGAVIQRDCPGTRGCIAAVRLAYGQCTAGVRASAARAGEDGTGDEYGRGRLDSTRGVPHCCTRRTLRRGRGTEQGEGGLQRLPGTHRVSCSCPGPSHRARRLGRNDGTREAQPPAETSDRDILAGPARSRTRGTRAQQRTGRHRTAA